MALAIVIQRGPVVEHRVHEPLGTQHHPLVKAALRDGRGESAACANPGDGDAIGIYPQLVGVLAHPTQGGHAVVKGCGERVFGGESVVRRHDYRAQTPREPPMNHQLELW